MLTDKVGGDGMSRGDKINHQIGSVRERQGTTWGSDITSNLFMGGVDHLVGNTHTHTSTCTHTCMYMHTHKQGPVYMIPVLTSRLDFDHEVAC